MWRCYAAGYPYLRSPSCSQKTARTATLHPLAGATPPGSQSKAGSDARRSFLTKMMASGFALAVQPVMADVIHTSNEGLDSGPTSISLPGDQKEALPAYYAKPMHAAKSLPVILVIQEVFGVHEHIQDI